MEVQDINSIGIIGAMKEEIEPIVKKLENVEEIEYANNIYYKGKYNNKNIIVVYSKIGKVFSTITTTILIEKFKCSLILFSGVAGGIDKELNIGDLIIAKDLCQHDVDITAFGYEHGFIPESKTYIETTLNLRELAKKVARKNNIKLIEGTIATGDQFIASQKKKDWILETFNAKAIEMEGASVATTCSELNIPFLIIRSISDTADEDANFNFDEFVEKSANRSADFLLNIVKNI